MQINLDFFKAVYGNCDTGKIEIRAVMSKQQRFFNLNQLNEMNDFCGANEKEDLYFGVALREGGGTKEHLTQIPCVWCDIDYKDTPRESLNVNLKNFPFQPSIFVKSGGGMHIYWLFKEPAEKEDIQKIENINRRIATSLGGDLNSCDAARILRIPGTVNHKYSHKPLCEVTEK